MLNVKCKHFIFLEHTFCLQNIFEKLAYYLKVLAEFCGGGSHTFVNFDID